MIRKVIFDIETKNIFSDVGENNPALLDISIVGIYDSETDTYSSSDYRQAMSQSFVSFDRWSRGGTEASDR